MTIGLGHRPHALCRAATAEDDRSGGRDPKGTASRRGGNACGGRAAPPGGADLRNHGFDGERTDEIRARLEAAVVGADVIVVQSGINDVVQGRSIELAADDLVAMVRRAKETAATVLLPDVLPWNNGWPDAEPAIRALNDLDPRHRRRRVGPGAPVPRHPRGSRPPGPDEVRMDTRRQPPVGRGASASGRAGVPVARTLGRRGRRWT